jgi:hypothetical protein
MIIAATSRTPEIIFSEQNCSIKGECYPENISEFSKPFMEKLASSLAQSESYKVDIEMYYFNSSSAKLFFDVFDLLDGLAAQHKQVEVVWRYREDDDTMLEAGEEFQEDLQHLKFIVESVD